MAKMYMSDSDDEPKKGSSRKSRVHVPEDSDESVMGLSDDSDEDDDLDDEFSENDYGADQGQAKDQYNYDDFDEEEDEFGNVHAIRAKKQEMGSDIEDENEDYMPDSRAWGSSIKNYIGSEYVDNDGEGITDKHRMIAEAEEEEGIATQKRLLDQLDEDALDFDLFATPATQESDSKVITLTKLDKLSKDEKLEYLKKESPELFVLIDDYKRLMEECENKIGRAIDELKQTSSGANDDDLYQFMCVKRQLIMRYCLNINFYLALKCRGKQVKQHPVRQTLLLYRKMLKEVQTYQENLGYSTAEALIAQIKENAGHNRLIGKTIIASKKSSKKRVTIEEESDSNEPIETTAKKSRKSKSLSLQEEVETKRKALQKAEDQIKRMEADAEYYSDEHQDEKQVLFVHKRDDVKKRKISRMIEKNKGLTPYRRKDHANPRLRYKSKFAKAEKKRRSQVSDPVKEISRYSGEYHGIKANTVRSVKIKS